MRRNDTDSTASRLLDHFTQWTITLEQTVNTVIARWAITSAIASNCACGSRSIPTGLYRSSKQIDGYHHDPLILRNVTALRSRSARIHVAATVDVIVDFARASGHATEQEGGERRHFHRAFAEFALAVARPQEFQQHRGDDGIDVNAEHICRHTVVVQGLHQGPVIVVEHVLLAAFRKQLRDINLARVRVDRVPLEYRVVDAGNIAHRQAKRLAG